MSKKTTKDTPRKFLSDLGAALSRIEARPTERSAGTCSSVSRPTGIFFTEAEARMLAAENKDWVAVKRRKGWMVWSTLADHEVEFG